MGAIRVDVTEKDIEAGVAGDCHRCPVALAFQRARPAARCVQVDCDEVGWREGPLEYSVGLPAAALEFVDAFDSHRGATPLSFTLTPGLSLWGDDGDEDDDDGEDDL